jgi:hypothetical protein
MPELPNPMNWIRALDSKFKIYSKELTNFRICYKALSFQVEKLLKFWNHWDFKLYVKKAVILFFVNLILAVDGGILCHIETYYSTIHL